MVKYNNNELTAVFHALADPTRRELIQILTRGPRSVTELAASFSMSLPAVSKHLKIMEGAGPTGKRTEPRGISETIIWFYWLLVGFVTIIII